MKKSSSILRYVAVVFLIGTILFFTSCVSNALMAPQNPLGVLGVGADSYVYIPMAGHRQLAEDFIAQTERADDLVQALDRTEKIVLASYPNGEVRIYAEGSFPRRWSHLIFPASKGWTAKKSSHGLTYYEGQGVQAVIPSNSLACIILNGKNPMGMEAMLSRFMVPDVISVSQRFSAMLCNDTSFDRAALWLADARKLVASLTGFMIGLDLHDLELYINAPESNQSDNYSFDLYMHAADIPSEATLKLLLERLLNGNVSVSGSEIAVKNGAFRRWQLQQSLSAFSVFLP